MIKFVTSINKKYWDQGFDFNLDTWLHFFPRNVKIVIYSEDKIENKPAQKNLEWKDLYSTCPKLVEFKEKHKDNPHYNGERVKQDRLKFRWNAIKFAHKVFPFVNEVKDQNTGKIVWLDADVLAHEKLTDSFFEEVCPNNYALSYLGRPGTWSECGWMYYNLDNSVAQDFLKKYEDVYTSNKLEELTETHDSFVFDHVMSTFEDRSQFLNLNTNMKTNKHPFHESPLRKCLTHHKGHNKERKQEKMIKRYNLRDQLEK